MIRLDQGIEFVWCGGRQFGITIDFSRPIKPTHNPLIEPLDGKFRAGWFDHPWFMSLDDARQQCEPSRRDHKGERPHSAIGDSSLIDQRRTARPRELH